jgi:hypothetical protein
MIVDELAGVGAKRRARVRHRPAGHRQSRQHGSECAVGTGRARRACHATAGARRTRRYVDAVATRPRTARRRPVTPALGKNAILTTMYI